MSELSDSIHDLPLAGLVPVALLVLVGLLLWSAGRQLLRPGFAAAGLLLGGMIGWIVGENVNLGVPAFVPAVIAGLALGAIAALAYRLAVAGALALVLAVASPLAVLAVNEVQAMMPAPSQPDEAETAEGVAPPDVEDLDAFDRWLNQRAREHFPGGAPQQPLTTEELARQFGLGEETSQHVGAVKNWAEAAYEAARQMWSNTPERLRPAVIGAAVAGALLGLLVGALTPGFSASIVTAFGGGLIWLSGARVISERVFEGTVMPTTTSGWLLLWITVSVIGLSIQWMFRPKRADKSER